MVEAWPPCDHHVSRWDSEYESACLLPKTHDGDHFDGASWWSKYGRSTDSRHQLEPEEDAHSYATVRGTVGGRVVTWQSVGVGRVVRLSHVQVEPFDEYQHTVAHYAAEYTITAPGEYEVEMRNIFSLRVSHEEAPYAALKATLSNQKETTA